MNSSSMDINNLCGIHILFPIHPSLAISFGVSRIVDVDGGWNIPTCRHEVQRKKKGGELRERGQDLRRYV
jgi:hypothetical protein